MNADRLLEVLIMCHNLSEERPFHHTHYRGFSLGIRLRASRKEGVNCLVNCFSPQSRLTDTTLAFPSGRKR